MKKILKNLKLDGLSKEERSKLIVEKAQKFLKSNDWIEVKRGKNKGKFKKYVIYTNPMCLQEAILHDCRFDGYSYEEYNATFDAVEYLEKSK